jgi:hypothetical protein
VKREMPKLDEYTNQDTEENRLEEVDFSEVEDKISQDFLSGGKPILETNTNATIKTITMKRTTEPKQDTRNREYYETILTITTELEDGQTSTDNYGGLREYPDGYWNSEKSAFGRLSKLTSDEYGVNNLKEMLQKISGSKVKIKTETNEFQGRSYQKNIIQSFR